MIKTCLLSFFLLLFLAYTNLNILANTEQISAKQALVNRWSEINDQVPFHASFYHEVYEHFDNEMLDGPELAGLLNIIWGDIQDLSEDTVLHFLRLNIRLLDIAKEDRTIINVRLLKDLVYRKLGRFISAREANLVRLGLFDDADFVPLILHRQADFYYEVRSVNRAVGLYDSLLRRHRDYEEIHLVYEAQSELYLLMQKYNDAFDLLNRYRATMPRKFENNSNNLLNLGKISFFLKNYDMAYGIFNQYKNSIDALKPEYPVSLYYLADIYRQRRQYNRAYDNYVKVMKHPSSQRDISERSYMKAFIISLYSQGIDSEVITVDNMRKLVDAELRRFLNDARDPDIIKDIEIVLFLRGFSDRGYNDLLDSYKRLWTLYNDDPLFQDTIGPFRQYLEQVFNTLFDYGYYRNIVNIYYQISGRRPELDTRALRTIHAKALFQLGFNDIARIYLSDIFEGPISIDDAHFFLSKFKFSTIDRQLERMFLNLVELSDCLADTDCLINNYHIFMAHFDGAHFKDNIYEKLIQKLMDEGDTAKRLVYLYLLADYYDNTGNQRRALSARRVLFTGYSELDEEPEFIGRLFYHINRFLTDYDSLEAIDNLKKIKPEHIPFINNNTILSLYNLCLKHEELKDAVYLLDILIERNNEYSQWAENNKNILNIKLRAHKLINN